MQEHTLYYFLSIPNNDGFLPIRKLIHEALDQPEIAPILTTMQSTLGITSSSFSFDKGPVKKIDFEKGFVVGSVVTAIKRSDFIIADLTGLNPNVLYEVGFAHALKKPVLLMVQHNSSKIPSNISGNLFFIYTQDEIRNSSDLLKDEIQKWVKNLKQTLFVEGD
jgi:hypothetical protein